MQQPSPQVCKQKRTKAAVLPEFSNRQPNDPTNKDVQQAAAKSTKDNRCLVNKSQLSQVQRVDAQQALKKREAGTTSQTDAVTFLRARVAYF